MTTFGDVDVAIDATTFVATVEIHRPPNNFFDVALIRSLAEAYESLDADPAGCRAIVLCSEGKHFCAGADFSGRSGGGPGSTGDLYAEALRLFRAGTPVVAAVQGASVGGGLGLACSADFRVVSPASRLTANFSRLGFHQGFGLSATLPRIVGAQRAAELLYTGRRIDGTTAASIGLADKLVDDGEAAVRAGATALAAEIAAAAPLAVRSIRETMRAGLADAVAAATSREDQEQDRLRRTADWAEGVRASAERREPRFEGR